MQGQARMTFAGPVPARTYAALEDCQRDATFASGKLMPDENGRFLIPSDGGVIMWYECRSKHVEEWEPAR